MDTFKLKIFAITAMFIDHFGAIFVSANENYWLYFTCRAIGRLAFPIFVFLIVEGFHHTHDVKKYLKRLGVFALISEIPFDLAFYKCRFGVDFISDVQRIGSDQSYLFTVRDRLFDDQNVFFTLFLGLLLITLMSMVEKRFNKNVTEYMISNILDAVLTLGFCAIAYILRTDYTLAGILMIVAFYLFRESRLVLALCTMIIMGSTYCNFKNFLLTGNLYAIISIFATFAIIPIIFYNGKKGKDVKYLFYIFYPAHLLLFFCIQLIV